MFDRAFVMSSPIGSERLAKFREALPRCVGEVETWPGVDGGVVKHPEWWTAGDAAWGSYRSHLGLLEYCYNADVESYIVFEDNATFLPRFEESWTELAASIPDDWEQIYLGGQMLHEIAHPPIPVNEKWLVPFTVNRMVCYAVHRRGHQKLYRHLHATPFRFGERIDGRLGRLHQAGAIRVYAPAKWLVGQVEVGLAVADLMSRGPAFLPIADSSSGAMALWTVYMT